MKVLNFGFELVGKTIKYCNLQKYMDSDHVVIITEDKEIMVFDYDTDCDYFNIYDEEKIKQKILIYTELRESLLRYGIITGEYIEAIEEERNKKIKEQDTRLKHQRHKEYLKLKQEFEGK